MSNADRHDELDDAVPAAQYVAPVVLLVQMAEAGVKARHR